jgi:hypothetical protein
MAVPALPPKRGRWLADTRRTWAAWHTSGSASLLDESGHTALTRLIVLVDDLGRATDPRERRLLGEAVRLQESKLGLGQPLRTVPDPAHVAGGKADAATEPELSREERRAERRREHDEEPIHADFSGTVGEWAAMSLSEREDFYYTQTLSQWESERGRHA